VNLWLILLTVIIIFFVIGYNPVGDVGVMSLGESLLVNRTMTYIDLSELIISHGTPSQFVQSYKICDHIL